MIEDMEKTFQGFIVVKNKNFADTEEYLVLHYDKNVMRSLSEKHLPMIDVTERKGKDKEVERYFTAGGLYGIIINEIDLSIIEENKGIVFSAANIAELMAERGIKTPPSSPLVTRERKVGFAVELEQTGVGR